MTKETKMTVSISQERKVPSTTCHVEEHDERVYGKIREDGRRIIEGLRTEVLQRYHDLGTLVRQAEELVTAQRNQSPIVQRLSADLGVCDRLLRLCAAFAESVPKRTLEQVVQSRMCWEHVRTLINHNQLEHIEDWTDRVTQEELSGSDLQALLRGGKTSQRKGSGRRPSPPRNLAAGLVQLDNLCTTVLNKFEYSLFADEFDLPNDALTTPPEDLTDEQRDSFSELAVRLEKVSVMAHENALRMRQSLPGIDRVIEGQKRDLEERSQEELGTEMERAFPNG